MPSMPRMRPMSGVMRAPATSRLRPFAPSPNQENHCCKIASSLKSLPERWHGKRRPQLIFGRFLVKNFLRFVASAAIISSTALPAMAAEINVGLITAMTGPGASIGIPYAKGAAAGAAYKDEVDGTKLNLIQLDDATDPSIATRNARKLIE